MLEILKRISQVPDSAAAWSLTVFGLRGRLRQMSRDVIAFSEACERVRPCPGEAEAAHQSLFETAVAMRAELDGLIADLSAPVRSGDRDAA